MAVGEWWRSLRPLGPSHEQEIAAGSTDGRRGACRGVAVMSAVSPDADDEVPGCSFHWVLAFQLWIARLE